MKVPESQLMKPHSLSAINMLLRNQHLEVNQRKNVLLPSFTFIILKFFIKSNQEKHLYTNIFFSPPSPQEKTHKHLVSFPNLFFFVFFPPKKENFDPKKTRGDNRQVPHRNSTSPTLRWSFGASPGGGHRRGGAWRFSVLGAVDLRGGHGFTNRGGEDLRGGRWYDTCFGEINGNNMKLQITCIIFLWDDMSCNILFFYFWHELEMS